MVVSRRINIHPLLLVWPLHCTKQTGHVQKWISTFESYNKLGNDKAKALLGWYAFKGTHNTGAFARKGVTSHFKAFMACNTPILDAFTAFGKTIDVPEWVVNQMERYICILYKPSGNAIPKSVKKLWSAIFAQNGK